MIRTTALLTVALASFAIVSARAESTADKAVADIVKAQTKLHSLKSLTADIVIADIETTGKTVAIGHVKCMKPNYLWMQTHEQGNKQLWYHISDGTRYRTNAPDGKWTSVPADSDGANFRPDLLLWSDFYVLYAVNDTKGLIAGADVVIEHKIVDGKSYEVITAKHPAPNAMTLQVSIASDGLIHRMTIDGGGTRMTDTWSNVKINPPLKPAEFKPKY